MACSIESIRFACWGIRPGCCFTNQPGIAHGTLTEARVLDLHRNLLALWRQEGLVVDDVLCCPHHPRAVQVSYRRACGCRKPAPGMLLAAARKWGIDLGASVMVGDHWSDVLCGRKAGCRSFLVLSGHGEREWQRERDLRHPDDEQADGVFACLEDLLGHLDPVSGCLRS